MKRELLALLAEEFPEIDFKASDALIDDGILDSLTITGIIAAISLHFGVVIPYEEIVEENFNSVAAMAGLVERLLA